MVKFFRYAAILVGLLIMLLVGTGSWVLYSSAGTRWLLNQLPEWAGTELTFGEIEGTLGGTLQLKDIELYHPELQLHLDRLSIQNRLRGLLPLTLEVAQLSVEQLQIKATSQQQERPPEPFSWPELPRLLDFLQVNLNNINLEDISWQQQEQKPFQIELFHGDLSWENSRLQSKNFILQSGELSSSGSFNCELELPTLQIDVQVATDDSATAWQKVQLQADLRHGSEAQILHGSVALDITVAKGKRLTAAAELELTPEQLKVQQLQLSRPNRSGIITAEGQLNFGNGPPELISQLKLSQFDLQTETGQPVQLSGTLQLKGNLEGYSGKFDLKNRGTDLTDAQLAGSFTGTQDNLSLEDLRGKWLDGILNGQAQIGWKQGWQLKTQLSSKDIDPQKLYPQLDGRLALDIQADFNGGGDEPPQGVLQLQLHDSILHNHPLSGVAELHLQGDSLLVKQLQLQGEGVRVQASGNPEEKLTFNWEIEGMEHLLTDTAGQFSGAGWLRWRQQKLTVDIHASGAELAFNNWQLKQLSLQAETGENGKTWQFQLSGQSLHNQQRNLEVDKVTIGLEGDFDHHRLALHLTQQQSSASTDLQGGWDGQQWQGELSNLQVTDSPFGNWHLQQAVPMLLSADQINLEQLSLYNDNGSELQLQGHYQLKQQQGEAKLHWHKLDLALFTPLLTAVQISGESDGSVKLTRGQKNHLHAKITASGMIQQQRLDLQVSSSEMQFDWDESGLQSSLQIVLADDSNLKGTLTSSQKNNFTWPQQGKVQLTGEEIPLSIAQPWIPAEINVDGKLSWKSNGIWQATEPLNLTGSAQIKNGRFFWQEEDEVSNVDISIAEMEWQWHKHLQVKLSVESHQHSSLETTFRLPLAAQLPLALNQDTPLNIDLHTQVAELGLFPLFFPEYIQKSKSQLKLNLQLTGSWRQPTLMGDFHLFDANLFIPATGVQLNQVELQGNIVKNHLKISQFKCSSGKGTLNGSGQLEFQNWYPANFQLQLTGKNFQLINLPELRVDVSPDLSIEGIEEIIKIRGQIHFPNLQINNQKIAGQISNSPDLMIVDQPAQPDWQRKKKYDIDIELLFDDQIELYAQGIDARLGGRLRLRTNNKQKLIGHGKLHVIQGTYSSRGAILEISHGNINFIGGPIDQPELDILALRRLNEVEVGVKISGTPNTLDIQLHSRPILPEGDILSYIFTGQPMSASRSQTNLIVSAGKALLQPQGGSRTLKNLGIDTFYISSDYDEGDEGEGTTIITTGKYLSPDLYISYGFAPDSNSDRAKVRYRLSPVWEVESTVGTDSGADLFYRIEIE